MLSLATFRSAAAGILSGIYKAIACHCSMETAYLPLWMAERTNRGGRWDLIIAHPPCTYLTLAGNKWFKPEYKDRFPDRQKQRQAAIDFFMKFANADCERIAIENPVCIMSSKWRKPDQYIEPYYFGEPEKKENSVVVKRFAAIEAHEHS